MRDNLIFYNRLKKFPLNDREHNEIEDSGVAYDLLGVEKPDRHKSPLVKVDAYDDYICIYVDAEIINILEYSNGFFFKIYGECKYSKFKIAPECADAIYRLILYTLTQDYNVKSIKQCSMSYHNTIMDQIVFIPPKLFNKMLDTDGVSFNEFGKEIFNDIVVLSESTCRYISDGEIMSEKIRNSLSEYGLMDKFEKILDAYNFFYKENKDE